MKRPLALFCLIISLFLAGSAHFNDNYDNKYGHLDGQQKILTGTVSDITYKRRGEMLQPILYLKEGVICYMSDLPQRPLIGSTITLKGKIFLFEKATNSGQFDMRSYYEIMGIHFGISNAKILSEGQEYSHFSEFMFKIRRHFSSVFDMYLEDTEASIIKTMILGEKSELDSELKDLYQRNGIAHVLSISGLHISLLGIGLYKLLTKLKSGIKPAAIISSFFMVMYGFLTGFSVSAIRAIFMFLLSMIAILIGRTYDTITAVSLCAMLMLFNKPLYIHHSGFIFSFGYILGIALLIPPLTTHKNGKASRIKKLLTPIIMTIIGLPIYYYFYYQLPIYAMFLNFLVIPVMSLLFPAGIGLLLFGFLYPPLTLPLKYLITGILRFFEISATFTDKLPHHFYTPGHPAFIQTVIFLLIMIIIIIFSKRLNLKTKWSLSFIAIIVMTLSFKSPLEITFGDVGQGDSILIHYSPSKIEFPGITPSYSILIDGGSSSVKEVGKYRIIPSLKYNGISKIDTIIATHPDQDHINGLMEILKTCSSEGIYVNQLILPACSSLLSNPSYVNLIKIATESSCEVIFLKKGDSVCYKDLKLECLNPSPNSQPLSENEASLVFKLSYNNFSALFTGDIEGESEANLLKSISSLSEITLLKVAHHGSKNSSSKDFISTVHPLISIISCGKNNSYGHPHKETLNRFKEYAPNSRIYRTDECGQVIVKVNKSGMVIKKFIDDNDDRILIRNLPDNGVHQIP